MDASDDIKQVTISVDHDDVRYCEDGKLPAPVVFSCTVSDSWSYEGVVNQESTYVDGSTIKFHAKLLQNTVDCVATIGEDIVLNSKSGVVEDGVVSITRLIEPSVAHRGD